MTTLNKHPRESDIFKPKEYSVTLPPVLNLCPLFQVSFHFSTHFEEIHPS
jgi:hypothetical protein